MRTLLPFLFVIAMGGAHAAAPEIQYRTFGKSDQLTVQACKKGISVNFSDSPVLTVAAIIAFQDAGCLIVSSPASAAARLTLEGRYETGGGKFKQTSTDLVQVVSSPSGSATTAEAPKPETTLITQSPASAGVSVAVDAALASNGIVSRGFAYGDIAASLSRAIGLTGAINEKLTGDPAGICAGAACENRSTIDQGAMIRIVGEQDGGKVFAATAAWVRSQTLERPERLIEAALRAAVKALLGQ